MITTIDWMLAARNEAELVESMQSKLRHSPEQARCDYRRLVRAERRFDQPRRFNPESLKTVLEMRRQLHHATRASWLRFAVLTTNGIALSRNKRKGRPALCIVFLHC